MAGPQETRVAAGVHVQQVARARPLVAVGRLLLRSRSAREAGPLEHLPHRRVGEARRAGDQARTPAGLAPAVTDPLLELARQQPRRAMWSARAVEERTRLAAAVEPTVPPTMSRRR